MMHWIADFSRAWRFPAWVLLAFPVSAQTVESVALGRIQTLDGLLVDDQGTLFAAGGYSSGELFRLTPAGEVETLATGLGGPIHLAKDAQGNLYCSNFRDGTVSRIAPNGMATTIARGLNGPAGLVMDPVGNLYVSNWGASGSGGERIDRITPEGRHETFVSGQGIDTPIGLALDSSGNLYVANAIDAKIHRISPSGDVGWLATVPRSPTRYSLGHMVCVGDKLYVSGNHRHVIYEVSLEGEVKVLAGSDLQPGDADGALLDARFEVPNGIAASPDGDALWVVLGGGKANRCLRKIGLAPNDASIHEAEADPFDAGLSIEEWASDLERLMREIRYRHPNPEHFGPLWGDFVADAERLRDALPDYPAWRIPWEFSRLVASLAEGHTWVDPWSLDAMGSMTPLRFAFFEDGVFVVGAETVNEDLLGARVLHIGALEPEEILNRARTLRLTSADNDMSVRSWTAWHLSMPSALAMLGAMDAPAAVVYELETQDGQQRKMTLDAVPRWARSEMALYRHIDGSVQSASETPDPYEFEVLAEARVLYWRWNGFREDPDRPFEAFCTEAFETFERMGLERLVLDLRSNGGGDPDFGLPVLRGILRLRALDKPNSLIILNGPATDSAAVSFGVRLEDLADPVFVGMPTFLRPNGHANALDVGLPHSGLNMHVSTEYWRSGYPSDRRPWIVPDVPVPVRFEDIQARRDLALEIALAGVAPMDPGRFAPVLRPGHAAQDLQRELRAWREDPARRWVDVEPDVNALGYRLAGAGRLDDAIEVFELNCRLHPYASNVYDSHGEALLKAGDERGALAAYRESVRRDHGNVAGIEVLIELEDRLGER